MSAAGQTPGNSFGRDGAREVSANSRSPCVKVQAQDSENPFTHVRDCRGKNHSIARTCSGKSDPEGERPNNHLNKLLFGKDCIYGKIQK